MITRYCESQFVTLLTFPTVTISEILCKIRTSSDPDCLTDLVPDGLPLRLARPEVLHVAASLEPDELLGDVAGGDGEREGEPDAADALDQLVDADAEDDAVPLDAQDPA